MASDRRSSLAAGVIPAGLILPGGIEGRQRIVRISASQVCHIAERRPDWLIFCLTHTATVLGAPEYLGYRPDIDHRTVEMLKRVGPERVLLLVAVKFLDDVSEAWVATAYRLSDRNLTRRLRNGTIQIVGGEP